MSVKAPFVSEVQPKEVTDPPSAKLRQHVSPTETMKSLMKNCSAVLGSAQV